MAEESPEIVTRFAPSPTGFLHIGGARTALFNWLFARGNGGKFLLRIEDTDRARSTPEATQAIFAGLEWLGLDWDGEAVSQAARVERHAEVARQMLYGGTAYRCYATQAEIAAFREAAKAAGKPPLFRSPWRDASPEDWPRDAPYTVRLKAPREGEVTVADAVQGEVTWAAEQMDDLILMRSDGTPTYMHAVVVDDHDMGITHVIRGDDHLTNAARQSLIYRAQGWEVPVFAHIPLIHGPDGAKLSKRHGALGVEAYRDMGYLPATMRNYLARLGWAHGDDEIFSSEQAMEWFTLGAIGRSPARFDFTRLETLNGHYMRETPDGEILAAIDGLLAARGDRPLEGHRREMLAGAIPGLKERVKTLLELLEMADYILSERPFVPDDKAAKHLTPEAAGPLARLTALLRDGSPESASEFEEIVRDLAASEGLKLGKLAQPIRAALTGRAVSPGVFDVMATLGREECIARLDDALASIGKPAE